MSPLPAWGGAFVNRNALFTLGGTSFAAQVWKVRIVPDTPFQQQRTLVPDGTISDVDSATYTMEIEGLQDYETGGLAAYLLTNAGSQVAFAYAPVNTTGKKKFTGTVVVVAAPAGGEQGEFAQLEVELPILGVPTVTTV